VIPDSKTRVPEPTGGKGTLVLRRQLTLLRSQRLGCNVVHQYLASTMRYLQPARGEKVQAQVEALWLPARAQ
jgi:hypothetical protein